MWFLQHLCRIWSASLSLYCICHLSLSLTESNNLVSTVRFAVFQSWKTAYWICVLALLLDCCSGAKQLCCLGQQAMALYVFYLQWNLYEPGVTSTWMGPSVRVLFWRHLISVHGTHSLKLGHTTACMYFKGNLGPLWGTRVIDELNNRQICSTYLCHCDLGTIVQWTIHWNHLSIYVSIHPSSIHKFIYVC